MLRRVGGESPKARHPKIKQGCRCQVRALPGQRTHLRCGQLALLLLSIAPGSLQLRPDLHQMLLLGSLCTPAAHSEKHA